VAQAARRQRRAHELRHPHRQGAEPPATRPPQRIVIGITAPGGSPCPTRSRFGRGPDITLINKRLAGDCHLTRRIADAIGSAGFSVDHLDTYYFNGEPKPFGYTF